jgi:hypothetical protein
LSLALSLFFHKAPGAIHGELGKDPKFGAPTILTEVSY